jgi:NAD(P)-dependent dehydrogenase (short-subunit alcohol dehydrogenase family)
MGSLPVTLAGRVALVTGAGRGIGRGCAFALADAGADVALISRTSSELEDVAAGVELRGRRALPLVCDVTDRAAVAAAVESLPRLDVLVHSAGANIPEPFLEVSEEHLDALLAVNVRAAFLVAQAAARSMVARRDGGAIVFLTSQMGHVGAVGRTVYCTTKHAVEGLTKALGVELAPAGIRVVAVAPTFVETPMTAQRLADPEFREWVVDRIPLGRLGTVEEVAAAVVFLASPGASLITGTSLVVDGGWTAQ